VAEFAKRIPSMQGDTNEKERWCGSGRERKEKREGREKGKRKRK